MILRYFIASTVVRNEKSVRNGVGTLEQEKSLTWSERAAQQPRKEM